MSYWERGISLFANYQPYSLVALSHMCFNWTQMYRLCRIYYSCWIDFHAHGTNRTLKTLTNNYILVENSFFLSSLYTEKDYNQAITFYTEAINIDPSVAAYYGNRSFAYLRTECFGYALSDANKALELDKTYIKVGK